MQFLPTSEDQQHAEFLAPSNAMNGHPSWLPRDDSYPQTWTTDQMAVLFKKKLSEKYRHIAAQEGCLDSLFEKFYKDVQLADQYFAGQEAQNGQCSSPMGALGSTNTDHVFGHGYGDR